MLTKWVHRHAKVLRLLQIANHRSSHSKIIPTGGGLGILLASSFVGLGFTLLLGWEGISYILGLAALLAALGLRDDMVGCSAWIRLGMQVLVCVGLLITLGDLPVLEFGVDSKIHLTGWVLFGFLLLAGVWWINLFNFMDGIDGIAATQAIFMLLAAAGFIAWFQAQSISSPVWLLMLFITAATIGFLFFNWPPAKIFMGNGCSSWLAFMIFYLALLSIQEGLLSYYVWLVLAAAFVADATLTLLKRMICGERWYEAHRSHAYQRVAHSWRSVPITGHRFVTLVFIGINLLWIAPWALASLVWPQWQLIWVLLAYIPLACVWTWVTVRLPAT